jgi:hypothetical protein
MDYKKLIHTAIKASEQLNRPNPTKLKRPLETFDTSKPLPSTFFDKPTSKSIKLTQDASKKEEEISNLDEFKASIQSDLDNLQFIQDQEEEEEFMFHKDALMMDQELAKQRIQNLLDRKPTQNALKTSVLVQEEELIDIPKAILLKQKPKTKKKIKKAFVDELEMQ